MSKRVELILSLIALGLLLNAAVGFAHLLRPAPATAQAALSEVNLTQISGKPLDVFTWKDGTASLRVVLDPAVVGGQSLPVYVKIAP